MVDDVHVLEPFDLTTLASSANDLDKSVLTDKEADANATEEKARGSLQ